MIKGESDRIKKQGEGFEAWKINGTNYVGKNFFA
jgi:hypothetical protein